MSSPISFDRPEWLWLLLVIPVIVTVSMRSLAGLDRVRRIVAVTLRCVVVALLAICLARVEFVRRHDNVAVMFVLDKSRSVPEDQRLAAQEYIRKVVKKADMDNRAGVIGFDGQADVDMIPSRGGAEVLGFGMRVSPDRTNIAAGVRLAMAAFPEGFARRIVLLTDGNENVGDLTEEIEAAAASNVAVDIVPLEYQHENEILFDRIVVPAHASTDTKIPVRMVIKSQSETNAQIRLYHNDEEVLLPEETYHLEGGMRPTVIRVPVELFGGGVHRFDARVTPVSEESDSMSGNNRATAFTFVEDQGRVLLVTQPDTEDDVALADALVREKVDLETRTVDQVTVDLLKLQEYSVVILANISADTFNDEQHKALASYVKDFGGGLIMTGGKDAFGAGGWIGTPVEEVSPVSFDIKHKQKMPRGALAIIMHSCEISRGNYWGEQVAIASVKTISSQDYLGVICYNPMLGGPNWDVPLALASDKAAVIKKIKQMQIGDMPDFGSTMKDAVTGLMGLKGVSQRHIIIISDGDPQAPSPVTIKKMIDNQITCSTVGIGYGEHVMEAPLLDIATQTKGKFYRCTNPRQLPQIFVKEARVVRRALIDDEPFQPALGASFAQTMLGIGGAVPPLGGLVLTEPKADITMPLVRKNKDGKDDPLLAHWNHEMGKMAVFASGWWTKWGADWAGWEQFGKFWSQVVRWAMRQRGSADFDVITRLEGNQGKVVIEALNKDASYLNFLQFHGLLTRPSMESEELHLTQTGPGQYEATFEVNDNGNYLVNLKYMDTNQEAGLIRTGLSVPYSPEFRELETNKSLLEEMLERSGGRKLAMNAETDDVFSRAGLVPTVSRQPVWRWVVQWLLLPLFLLDVAGRRLASALAMSVYVELAVFGILFGILYAAKASLWRYVGALVLAELIGWTVRYRYIVPTVHFFTTSVRALSRAGQRSSESLTHLKDVRDKVREEMEEKTTRATEPGTIELERLADPKARFEVDEKTAARPAGDLTGSLRGATASEDFGKPKPAWPKPGQKADEAADLTSRLLKAKRRARDQMKSDEDKES